MNRKLVLVIAVAVILVLGIVSLPLNMLPLTNYGDPDLWEETNDVQMSTDDTLNVQDGDTLVAWLRDDPDTQHKPTDLDWTVTLRRSDNNDWIEDGGDSSKIGELYPSVVGDNMRWWFNLESCLEGTFSYHVFWFAMVGDTDINAEGYSFAFTVVNTEPPIYDDAEFVTEPDTEIEFTSGQLAAYATWKVDYDGPFTASVTVDSNEDWTNIYPKTAGDDLILYPVNTDVAGNQSIILTITPDVATNPPLVSETITITIEESDENGDDDTDTTTTTTTTTTEPPPDEYDAGFLFICVGLGIVVAMAIVLKAAR